MMFDALDTQRAFRALLSATAEPGSVHTVPAGLPIGPAEIELEPTVFDQELDTRATTGVAYWEGSQNVFVARLDDRSVADRGSEAYVEMTRYGP